MLKKDARKIFREKRSLLTLQEQGKLDDLLLIQLQRVPLPFVTTLLSYWPISANNEPSADLFTDFLLFQNPGLRICYPQSNFEEGTMKAILTNEDTVFVQKEFAIYEPDEQTVIPAPEIDIVWVPLLAFDKKGYRVGYGKGFYDRYLANCRTDCCKIGFSYFEPVEALEDSHEFDVPLDFCITPQHAYVF